MSTTPITKPRGVELLPDPPPMTEQSRSQVLNIGVMAVAAHAAHYQLPAPLSIDLEPDPRRDASISVRVAGFGDAQRWLNTVHVDDQVELYSATHSRFTWTVRLPETGTRVFLTALRRDELVP